MGIYTNILANTQSFDAVLPRDGIHRVITREIQTLLDRLDIAAAAAYAAANAVHVIATDAVDHTGGDFILTLRLQSNGVIYVATTTALAYNINAATMLTAINVAVTAAAYPGWVNGHIVVTASSTDLQGGTITLTFSGDSVAGRGHGLTTMVDSRTGGTSPDPTIAATALGNATREAMAALIESGTIIGAAPTAGSDPSWTAGQRSLGRILSLDTIRALARDAAIADYNDGIYTAVEALYAI